MLRTHLCLSECGELRGQFVGVSSLLPPRSQELNSGRQDCQQVSLTAEPSTFTTKPLAISGTGFGQGDISSDELLMRELLILCSCLTYRELEVGGRDIRKRPDDYQRLYILRD